MKKNGYWKGFTSALVLMALVAGLSVTATAAGQRRTIEVEDGIKISINDARFIPRDNNGKKVPVFLYEGTTYVPVRAVCEAAGMEVAFDSKTRTVELTTPDWELTQRPESKDYISGEEAKEIALEDAGVKASKAVFLRVRLDWDDKRPHYDVEFYSRNAEYDYEIDAVTGKILHRDRNLDDFEIPQWVEPDKGGLITEKKARQIALDRVDDEDARVVKCQLDEDDGRWVYEVEVRLGGAEYDFEIDASSGRILDQDMDYEDDDD